MRRTVVSLIFCLGFLNLQAQTSTCPLPEDLDSKAEKLFEKASNPKKKTTTDDRVNYLREAIELQNDYVQAYELLSQLTFKLCKRNASYLSECRQVTAHWISLCEGYDMEADYILGALEFMSSNPYLAIEHFSV